MIHTPAVAGHPNFHHAANVLGTTHSCVSTRIKALEEAHGRGSMIENNLTTARLDLSCHDQSTPYLLMLGRGMPI